MVIIFFYWYCLLKLSTVHNFIHNFAEIHYLQQRLDFNGNELKNYQKLLHYNIQKNCKVDLIEKTEVLIGLFHQRGMILYVEASDTIEKLKQMINETKGQTL